MCGFRLRRACQEAISARDDLDWTILKPSILWGERDGFFNVIADLVRISPGLVPVPAGARSRYQPIWIGDLATVLTRVVDDPTPNIPTLVSVAAGR